VDPFHHEISCSVRFGAVRANTQKIGADRFDSANECIYQPLISASDGSTRVYLRANKERSLCDLRWSSWVGEARVGTDCTTSFFDLERLSRGTHGFFANGQRV
jgi:hypothetical protein